jgi:hypothetical protein
MFLTAFILALTAGHPEKVKQEDIDFCKGVKFVPLKVGVWNVPDEFPAVYATAMDDLWFYLFTTVKVRDSDLYKDVKTNLTLAVTLKTNVPFIAAASPIERDRCKRPSGTRNV